jgi:hypothetical protein
MFLFPTPTFLLRLLFDSRATMYEHRDELSRLGVGFITIRRRGAQKIQRVRGLAKSAWQSCQITQAHGRRRRVRCLDERVSLEGYRGEVRQLVLDGLGHESPTFMVYNDLPEVLDPRLVLESYASRNHVEQALYTNPCRESKPEKSHPPQTSLVLGANPREMQAFRRLCDWSSMI